MLFVLPSCHHTLCFTGLPIQVRDTGLSVKDEVPKSDVNKEYYTQNMEREVQLLSNAVLVYMMQL